MKRMKRSNPRNCAPNTVLATPELIQVKGGATAIEYGLVTTKNIEPQLL